jgi:hypothetical protein
MGNPAMGVVSNTPPTTREKRGTTRWEVMAHLR